MAILAIAVTRNPVVVTTSEKGDVPSWTCPGGNYLGVAMTCFIATRHENYLRVYMTSWPRDTRRVCVDV